MPVPTKIIFFKTPANLRRWFEKNHHKQSEQWIGFYKKNSGKQSITWPESVDQALCFGWIDGVRKSLESDRYTIRFTPRKQTSIWSAVNIRRFSELQRLGVMTGAGLEIFQKRDVKKSNLYSFEQRKNPKLPAAFLRRFTSNAKAWEYFSSMPPWYRRTSTWWVISAKQEPTRLKRLAQLIHDSERKKTIPVLTRAAKK